MKTTYIPLGCDQQGRQQAGERVPPVTPEQLATFVDTYPWGQHPRFDPRTMTDVEYDVMLKAPWPEPVAINDGDSADWWTRHTVSAEACTDVGADDDTPQPLPFWEAVRFWTWVGGIFAGGLAVIVLAVRLAVL